MIKRKDTYTGFLTYREFAFSFVFTDDELRLIPPPEKSDEIRKKWFMKKIGTGAYTNGDPVVVEEYSITGVCNETNGSIIFLPRVGSILTYSFNYGNNSLVLHIDLYAYILCRFKRGTVSRLSFMGPEINHIHPVNQAFSWIIDPEADERGVIKIETKDYSSTTTKAQSFLVDGKAVTSKFDITRGISTNIGDAPLSLQSTLIFEFEPSNDYRFILRLCRIAKEYISYLCYRRNIIFDGIELSAPYKGGKYERFATLYVIGGCKEPDEKALKNNRCILQTYIDNGESKTLQDISDNRLYIRHIPVSYESGLHIDASRFVMITAALEWEFNRMKPDGLQKSEGRKQAEDKANSTIDEIIGSTTGKEKEIYKYLKKQIGGTSLQNKIVAVCEELDPIIGEFGKHLYSLNNEELVYTDLGARLAEQRNNYAHGNIDKDIVGKSLLDLVFLQYVIYAMQLKYYGITKENIRKAINNLFHLGFVL